MGYLALRMKRVDFPRCRASLFKYSPSQRRGSRIEAVSIAGKPIDPGREYIVATNDFLAAGGDGYRSFEEATRSSKDFSVMGGTMKGEKVVYGDSGKWLRDGVAEYIREKGRVAPKIEGRIIEIRQ